MKRVALVDPFYTGHHGAYMRYFVDYFQSKGYEVVVFMPNSGLTTSGSLDVVHFELKRRRFRSLLPHTRKVLLEWRDISKSLKIYEKAHQGAFDLVFFTWLDFLLANYLPPVLIPLIFKWKWSGLYFHPRHMRLSDATQMEKAGLSQVDSVLFSKNCLGISIHDPGILDLYRRRLGKPVVKIPEFADDTHPNLNNSDFEEIRSKAQGRTVIGMIGLAPHQGFSYFCELALWADADSFYFVFAGNWNEALYSSEERDLFERCKEKKNASFILRPLSEGEEYNSVFNAIDVVFLVYKNFTSTSNRMTKACFFKKLIIASNRHIIGEEMNQYHLGVTVDENVDSVQEGLLELMRLTKEDKLTPKWNEYLKAHGLDNFYKEMDKLLEYV